MKKKSVLIYLLTICSLLINAQVHSTETTGVLAPDGASQIDDLPVTIGTFAQYTYSQTIYTAQQINASGDIDSLAFYPDTFDISLSTNSNWLVLIGHTSKLDFDNYQTSITITSLVPNTGYDVYIRAICSANDSSAWSAAYSFTLDSTVSIIQFSKSDINVYPNPNNGRFTLELDKEPNSELNITISNATGQVVHRQLITSSVNIFDLQGVRKGVYILDLFSENQSVKTRNVID